MTEKFFPSKWNCHNIHSARWVLPAACVWNVTSFIVPLWLGGGRGLVVTPRYSPTAKCSHVTCIYIRPIIHFFYYIHSIVVWLKMKILQLHQIAYNPKSANSLWDHFQSSWAIQIGYGGFGVDEFWIWGKVQHVIARRFLFGEWILFEF